MDRIATAEFDLEAEIRDLAARRDITDVLQRYMRGLDRLDPALVRSAFHADARIDVGLMQGGADAYVAFTQTVLGGMTATHHLLGQVRIELDGNRAIAESYFQAWQGVATDDGGLRDLFIAGRYVDALACRDRRWGIVSRTLVTDWVRDEPGGADFFTANPALVRGARHGADFSQTFRQGIDR
ncbi:nuclear transport factor 2 family protein [Sphingomonas populi]|uniref:Nuclear transport factor 2 family protein n=2 Tax=Sphingomonas populi TaxID=2484750 RepID=A0A4Q6Y2C9_9SPHN|nr:nuclear transport factor 2 family protein [Sphingomonas populi]